MLNFCKRVALFTAIILALSLLYYPTVFRRMLYGRYLDVYLVKHKNYKTHYAKLNRPKLIYISGSSGLYGFSATQAQNFFQDSSYVAYNYGLIGAVGIRTIKNIIENEFKEGDIVIFGGEIALSAFNNAEINTWQAFQYKSIKVLDDMPITEHKDIVQGKLRLLFTFFDAQVSGKEQQASGKSRIAIQSNGDLPTSEYKMLPYDIRELYHGKIKNKDAISENVKFILKINRYCQNKNITFTVAHAPVSEYLYLRDKQFFDYFYNSLSKAGIKIITSQQKSIFPVDKMYDYHYHPGKEARTEHTKNVISGLYEYLKN